MRTHGAYQPRSLRGIFNPKVR